ncbi:hypothetical protein DYBT9275_02331 [Dyadobacter sp. CECT 9275]|uniref:Alpha glucuronidase N-terminal domain-containing protein n=1 Tax=Dyadobacter helix TaxID=2822344 RepID=A0A916JCW9_9BACT|nr:DUF4838 domain-containing protein [Dyadobacter sp. CECT 9275]CAG4999868.1 hypothetical protein DYBT9275_02331 [Dyadobacter sp. CECT 9275]
MKYLFIILTTCLLHGCSSGNKLVSEGTGVYKIFVSEKASKPETYAAQELQKYIQQISGAVLPIVHEAKPADKLICVGFEGAPESLLKDLKIKEFGKEEYIIRSDGDQLLIAGGGARGTLYGVIGYLSDYLGCRWYTREVTKIPQQKTISLDKIEDRQKPVMEARQMSYREAYDVQWALHNRFNHSQIPDSLGSGNIAYPFVHTFYALVSPQKYGKTHPEYFSEVDGKRLIKETNMGGQLCLTNPEVVKIATATVFEWIKTHPEASVYTVDQNDGEGYCTCKNCKELDDREGSHSGTLIQFVNQIADSVAQVYPEVTLQTLAYAYTEIPPKTLKPADNVTIRLCHYDYCSAHKLGACDDHKRYIERLDQWSKIAKRITIWDYYTNFERYLLPFPNFETIKHDPKFYADRKAIGLFPEGNNVDSDGGGEFSELRAWVFSQMLWNPERDGQKLIDEFVENVFGEASPFISQYIKLLHDQVKPDSVYFSIWEDPEDVNYLSSKTIRTADSLFTLAKNAAKNDTALYNRVELAYLPVLYTQLYFYSIGGSAYLARDQVPSALATFEKIIQRKRITSLGVVALPPGNLQNFIRSVKSKDQYLSDWWVIGPFDNEGRKGFSRVYPPEQQFDTTKAYPGKGADVKWRKYENTESGFIDFARLFKPNQDVVAYAYRTITLPEAKTVKLGIGSNDGVRVWINNRLVLDRLVSRPATPNEDKISIPMKKGENTILVKVDQLGKKWGFYFAELN